MQLTNLVLPVADGHEVLVTVVEDGPICDALIRRCFFDVLEGLHGRRLAALELVPGVDPVQFALHTDVRFLQKMFLVTSVRQKRFLSTFYEHYHLY